MNYLEDHLDMPLPQVLRNIQDRANYETTYFGIRALRNPFDLWVYQEIIFDIQPDLIVEIGNFHGGTLLALAHLCDNLGKGSLIGVDLTHESIAKKVREHPRIRLIEGDACASFERVASSIPTGACVLVIEDSSHTYENTLSILRTYSELVTPGSYFIVEDGICHHDFMMGPSPGPYQAIETFMDENDDFIVDRTRESFLITWNLKGYLKRR